MLTNTYTYHPVQGGFEIDNGKADYVQFFNEKAHSNILMVDLNGEKQIEKITLEALSCEILAGLPGVTVAKTAE